MSGRVKPSRFLKRLDAEIAGAKSPLDANCKRAERIAYLARLGPIAQARSELAVLRGAYASHPNAEMSSWLNLAEGLIEYFGSMSGEAREKLLRAHALSTAANLGRIRALSAAWLAHLDFVKVDVVSMTRHAGEALRFSSDNEHAVRSRVSLAVAQAYHLAGRLDIGQAWYARARTHAVADGDDAMVSAHMYNMAALRGKQLRAVDCGLAATCDERPGQAMLGADSTASFDSLIGATSLPWAVPLLRAQIMTVQGDSAGAIDLFESDALLAARHGPLRVRAALFADRAWCHARLGQAGQALDDAEVAAEVAESLDVDLPSDEQALVHARLAQTFTALGDKTRAKRHAQKAKSAWAAHAVVQSDWLEALDRLPQPGAQVRPVVVQAA